MAEFANVSEYALAHALNWRDAQQMGAGFFFATVSALILVSAVWLYVQRDFIGMAVCLILAAVALYAVLRY
uniref:hypothetical protein n=1 Tax=Mesorhizobium sp. WSM4875 TaxID=3038539 RepID=UPI002417EC46|nr:hypothetical protein [Mesorhizobium sp. WSM4875]WIE94778.1 hypothetical protein P9270_030065 [Mesorhizobium sp. WSM4875]